MTSTSRSGSTTGLELELGRVELATLDLRSLAGAVEALAELERLAVAGGSGIAHHRASSPERADLDAVDVVHATRLVLTRGADPGLAAPLLDAAIVACERNGAECEQAADRDEHCREGARASRAAAAACRRLLATLDA